MQLLPLSLDDIISNDGVFPPCRRNSPSGRLLPKHWQFTQKGNAHEFQFKTGPGQFLPNTAYVLISKPYGVSRCRGALAAI